MSQPSELSTDMERKRNSIGISTNNQANPFYRDSTKEKFVSHIPIPSFSASQPAIGTITPHQQRDPVSRVRRNSASAIPGTLNLQSNKNFMSNEEPMRKKSKSSISNTTQANEHKLVSNTPNIRRSMSMTGSNRQSLPNNTFNTSMTNDNSNIRKDLRPLRDKNFQTAIQQEILDYLLTHKFDIQTNHPISLKSLRQPTQKSFTIIFAWLYQRLDPGYAFNKNVESELYQIMKNLNYPYLETINKSQISAVGGSSWHKFLGLLHWLMKLNIQMDIISQNLDNSLLNQPTQDMIQMNNPIPDSLDQQDEIKSKYESMIETLVIEYTMDAYKMFLNSNDDFRIAMQKFHVGFEKFVRIINADINILDSRNETILKQYEQILERAKGLRISKERYTALQNDVQAFENYISIMETKSKEWPKKLEKMRLDKEQRQEQINEVEAQIRRILGQLDGMDISVEQIESKTKEHEKLLQSLDDKADKSDKSIATLQMKRIENKNVVKNLLGVLDRYNQTLDSIMTDRVELTGRNSMKVEQFKIEIANVLENLNDETRLEYSQIFTQLSNNDESFSLKDYITEKVINLIEDIELNCGSVELDINNLGEEIKILQEEVKNKSDKTKNMREQALDVQSEVYSLKQDYEQTLVSQRSQIDELNQKNRNTIGMINKKLRDANQLVVNKKQKLLETEKELDTQKQLLQNKIFEIIKYTVEFKLNIQDSLEDTKDKIINELAKLDLK